MHDSLEPKAPMLKYNLSVQLHALPFLWASSG